MSNAALRRAAPGLLLLLAALWLGGPLMIIGSFTHSQWYWSHDGMRWPYVLTQFSKAFASGILYPRWMPNMLGGYGYPTFVYYQPGFFYFAMIFFVLAQNGVAAVSATIIAAAWLGGLGAYRLARHWNGCRFSLGCALVFMLTPYAGINLYDRGDLTEYFAMQLCPWCLHFGLRLVAKARAGRPLLRGVAAFVSSAGLLVISHPFVALFFLPFLGAVMLAASLSATPSAEAAWVCSLAFAMVIVITVPYWFTLVQLKGAVRYQAGLMADPADHLLPLSGFKDLSMPARHLLAAGWMALPAGAGFATGLRTPLIRTATFFFLLYLLMMTEFSRALWEMAAPVLNYVQFSFRIMATLACIELMGIALAGPWIRQRRRPVITALIVAGMPVFAAVMAFQDYRMGMTATVLLRPFSAEGHGISLPGEPLAAVDYPIQLWMLTQRKDKLPYVAAGLLDPKWMALDGLQNRVPYNIPLVQMAPWAKNNGSVRMLPRATPYKPVAEVVLKQQAAILVNQFYLPGWRVEVDGAAVPWNVPGQSTDALPGAPVVAGIGANGRIRVWFAKPGTYRLSAWYEGPPHWQARNLLMLLLLLLLSAGCYWRRSLIERFKAGKFYGQPVFVRPISS